MYNSLWFNGQPDRAPWLSYLHMYVVHQLYGVDRNRSRKCIFTPPQTPPFSQVNYNPTQMQQLRPSAPPPPVKLCVFCSTTSGASPAHLAAARSLAEAMHARSMHLIYGAGTTGMMGELAKTLVGLSGPDSVVGIIPRGILDVERPANLTKGVVPAVPVQVKGGIWARLGLRKEIIPSRKTRQESVQQRSTSMLQNEAVFGRVIIVSDMQARKKRMAQEAATGGPGSGFIGLSGGLGTMDELMEAVTWNQLGVHRMGVCLFNVEGYWDGILRWLEDAIEAKFVRESAREILGARDTAEECIEWLKAYGGEETCSDAEVRGV